VLLETGLLTGERLGYHGFEYIRQIDGPGCRSNLSAFTRGPASPASVMRAAIRTRRFLELVVCQ